MRRLRAGLLARALHGEHVREVRGVSLVAHPELARRLQSPSFSKNVRASDRLEARFKQARPPIPLALEFVGCGQENSLHAEPRLGASEGHELGASQIACARQKEPLPHLTASPHDCLCAHAEI